MCFSLRNIFTFECGVNNLQTSRQFVHECHVISSRSCGHGDDDTHFLAEVRAGDFALARASITARTGTLVFVDGLVQVEGRSVLTARGVLKILRPHRTP